MGNGSETMSEQTNGVPTGWGWRQWSTATPVLYLYAPGKHGVDFHAAASPDGSWCAYASLDGTTPCAEHETDDNAEQSPEALATAQRAAEDALWRVDGFGVNEARGVHLPAIEPYTKGPTALPGLAGLWTVTRWVLSPTGSGVEVDARKVTAGESEAPTSLWGRAAEMQGEPVVTHGSEPVDKLALARNRVAELEADLGALHLRHRETVAAFDAAAPDALRAFHKRQVDAQGLDATHGAEMAEMIRAGLRRKPVAGKVDGNGDE